MMHFKQLLIILITELSSFYSSEASAQVITSPDSLSLQEDIIKDFHWFRKRIQRYDGEKRWTYYLNGNEYEIEINCFTTKDLMFSTKKGITKFLSAGYKKTYQRKDDIPWLPLPNSIFYTSSKLDTISISSSSYIVADTDSCVYQINMLRYDTRDSVLEKELVYSIIKNGIRDSFFLAPGPNMIDFAGRIIQIKNYFEWMAPDNIYCPAHGQMNWSVHSTMAKAVRARDFQLIGNTNLKLVDVLKKDTITVVFEESPAQALRITYRSKEPRIFWGKGSKILLVYYIIAPVRDRFVTCVLSHYEDQLVNGNVPPPLNSVMSLKN